MPQITLPDGKKLSFSNATTGLEIANSIGAGLAKASLAVTCNGDLRDLNDPITEDSAVSIITNSSDEGAEIIRHSTAHIMAEAVKELYPNTQVTIGPSIHNGFYYDFAKDSPFSSDDLENIEAKMQDIIARDEPFVKEVWTKQHAVEYFKSIGEEYKLELIEAIPDGQDISIYKQGEFLDLCRGVHVPSTGKIGAFKLTKVAGAYWRGDSNNAMLQRIYGLAFATKKELNKYIVQLEEAEKRDHRKLGKELDLFHFEESAQGQPFWHDKGYTIYRILENFVRKKRDEHGYKEVRTPLMMNKEHWERSGHWDKFRENMFISEVEDKTLALKPMSCPGHVVIFNQHLRSYRELPLRMAEFGQVFRNEPSGALHGLMRVRAFTQDDSHIFCTEDQITSETIEFCKLLEEIYTAFGFDKIKIKLADRPDSKVGDDATWDKAEACLKDAIDATGLPYSINKGEGAFYGPKLEFVLTDAIGRDWQCGTLQVDFVLPERLDASYIGKDGEKHRPVFLHCALLGSLERFLGILIEHYGGKFPLWLAPVQVVVAGVTNDVDDYAKEVYNKLLESGLRAELDISSDKIGYKIREYSTKKVPVIFAVGKNEQDERTVSIRRLGSKNQTFLPVEEAISNLTNETNEI